MGGIAGVICLRECREDHRATVARMCELQSHRERRPATITASDRAIFGMLGTPAPAPGLLLALDGTYPAHGLQQERLPSSFALATHNVETGTSTLVRDPLGSKSILWTVQEHHLWFASEAKPLIGTILVPRPNRRALTEWALYGDVLPQETLWEGLSALPPGHLLEIDAAGRVGTPQAYFSYESLPDADRYAGYDGHSSERIVTELDGTLREAVDACLEAERPAAVLLSGGVDSTIIAAMAREHGTLVALHLSAAEDPSLDERAAAEEGARYLGIPFEALSVDTEAYRRELARVTFENESPLFHMQCIPFSMLACRAAERGLRLLLTGDGADAMVGLPTSKRLSNLWLRLGRGLLGRLPRMTLRSLSKAVNGAAGMPVGVPGFAGGLGLASRLLDADGRVDHLRRAGGAYAFVADPAERKLQAGRLAGLGLNFPRFLHRGDRLAAAVGTEFRTPLLHLPLLRLGYNLPGAVLRRERVSKWPLREAATRYVPRRIAYRRKLAWGLPARAYLEPIAATQIFTRGFLSENLGLPAASIAEVVDQRGRDPTPFFILVQLEVWGRLFIRGQTPEEVTEILIARV